MSRRSTGLLHEKQIADILTANGWLVQRAGQKVKFIGKGRVVSQQADFWGCIDILALEPKTKAIRAIQAGAKVDSSTKKKLVRKVLGRFASVMMLEVWSWGKYDEGWGWKVETLAKNGRWVNLGIVKRGRNK